MAKLIHKNKTILNDMKYADTIFSMSKGLMFASRYEVKKGLCIVFPLQKDKKYSAAVTMMFCFMKYEILFVNTNFEVVDKVVLNPFRLSYVPKAPCKYVIESLPNSFKNIKIGDKIKIEK